MYVRLPPGAVDHPDGEGFILHPSPGDLRPMSLAGKIITRRIKIVEVDKSDD